jgi:hypothetical protein
MGYLITIRYPIFKVIIYKMDDKEISRFEEFVNSTVDTQFQCFKLSPAMKVTCTLCDRDINYKDKHHLT